jgi:pimeloyl-ACP methyl ester carboxylesterase
MTGAPPLSLLFGELRVARDWLSARTRPRSSARDTVSDGAPVMTLPGFCAGDISMRQLRAELNSAGFRARRWKMGPNLGARSDTIERIDARVRHIADDAGRPVHLIGWSLGGVFAREYAHRYPDHVASVITMGSPFSGDPRANNAWRLYRLIAGHSVDNPPIARHVGQKPAVPTYALWSPRDGVVAPASAMGAPHERDAAIEMDCGHMSFAFLPAVVDTLVSCLMEAEQRINRA